MRVILDRITRIDKAKMEWAAVAVIFLVYTVLQINAINHGNYSGQDFQRHKANILNAVKDPIKALTRPVDNLIRGVPSMYHLFGAAIYRLAGEQHYLPTLATCNLGFNLVALGLLYLLIRRVIFSPVLRVAWLGWTAFLPFFVICSVVISSDAAIGIGFTLILWLNVLAFERGISLRRSGLIMSALAFLLILMVMFKMNFALCIFGELLILAVLGTARWISLRQIVLGLVLLVMIPAAGTLTLHKLYLRGQSESFFLKGQGGVSPELAKMSLRSLLFFRPTDWELLKAPYFHQMRYGIRGFQRKMLVSNYYSYPGMMPLGIFTDIFNNYQPIYFASDNAGVVDEYYTRIRPPENKIRMQWALKIGLIFYFAGFFLIPWMVFMILGRAYCKKLEDSERILGILAALSGCVIAGTVASLPVLFHPYAMAGWLPRLYWPALVGLYVLFFAALERGLVRKFPAARWVILAVVLLQSSLNISFLWVGGHSNIRPSVEFVQHPR